MSYFPSYKTNNWQGKLHLIYGKRQGKTIVNHAFASAPLRIQRPFYPEGEGICHSVVLHTAGGIVGGDRLKQNLELETSCQISVCDRQFPCKNFSPLAVRPKRLISHPKYFAPGANSTFIFC